MRSRPAPLRVAAWGISLLLHLLFLSAVNSWFARESREEIHYPVRFHVGRPASMRFRPTPPPSETGGKDLTAEAGPASMPDLLGGGPVGIAGGQGRGLSPAEGEGFPGVPLALEGAELRAGKAGSFTSSEESRGLGALLTKPVAEADVPVAMDLLELDAERRERTVVLIDPQTRKLKKAYLHLPVYRNDDPTAYNGGREVVEIYRVLNNRLMRYRTPIECLVRYYRMGTAAKGAAVPERGRTADAIHSFPLFPSRHLLSRPELAQYPVVFLSYIDVESTQAMVDYLAKGGFAVVNQGQLALLYRALQQRYEARVQRISVGLEHPLFHCEFDITGYVDAALPCCPAPVAPLAGLELDGRLVALSCPPFVWRECTIPSGSPYTPPTRIRADCPSNQLYVNALVYGLIQPSRMGGRYWSMQ